MDEMGCKPVSTSQRCYDIQIFKLEWTILQAKTTHSLGQ